MRNSVTYPISRHMLGYTNEVSSVTLGLRGQRYGGTLVKLGKSWSKAFTNYPLVLGWNYCIPTYGGQTGYNSSTMVSHMSNDWIYFEK